MSAETCLRCGAGLEPMRKLNATFETRWYTCGAQAGEWCDKPGEEMTEKIIEIVEGAIPIWKEVTDVHVTYADSSTETLVILITASRNNTYVDIQPKNKEMTEKEIEGDFIKTNPYRELKWCGVCRASSIIDSTINHENVDENTPCPVPQIRTLEAALLISKKHTERWKKDYETIAANSNKFEARVKELEIQAQTCRGTREDILDGEPLPGDWSDGTDGACPGWWRGHDNGCEGMEKKMKKGIEALQAQLAAVREEINNTIAYIKQRESDSDSLNYSHVVLGMLNYPLSSLPETDKVLVDREILDWYKKVSGGIQHAGCNYFAIVACNKCGWVNPEPNPMLKEFADEKINSLQAQITQLRRVLGEIALKRESPNIIMPKYSAEAAQEIAQKALATEEK